MSKRQRRSGKDRGQSTRWAFPTELVRHTVDGLDGAAERLTEWSTRAQAEGHASSTTFAFVDNSDHARVLVIFGTRERWIRERPDIADDLRAEPRSDLLITVVERGVGQVSVVTLTEFRAKVLGRMRAAEVIHGR